MHGRTTAFERWLSREFTDLYVVDLGSDVRRNPKISGTTHNVFGIQTGVAIGFFVREKARLGNFGIHYSRREDAELAVDKLAYLRETNLKQISFDDVTADSTYNWLNQSNPEFIKLLALADRQTKFAAISGSDQAVFRLFANAVKSNRDDWVFDFDVRNLRDKALFFSDTYNESLASGNESYDSFIKWSSTLQERFRRKEQIVYNDAYRMQTLFRPFVVKHHFAEVAMNDRLTQNHYEMFGANLHRPNEAINVCVNGKAFYVLATDKLVDYHFTGDTQCLPLYRYTDTGERVSNITDWGLRQFREHYGDESITAEDIFAYTYAALHDPAYRDTYAVDLLREFPRLPFHEDFAAWVRLGQELLDLHIGFEDAEPFALERVDKDRESGKAALKADKVSSNIVLDSKTILTGVPVEAWNYRLGSRSALEWVLDQYKERTPRDPTIRERFNTYRFADHKEGVIDLLQRVCTVSVETVRIVSQLDSLTNIEAKDETHVTAAQPTGEPDNQRSRS